MNNSDIPKNPRILVIDDNRAIHHDFCKILCRERSKDGSLAEEAAKLFERFVKSTGSRNRISFEIDSAYQGQEGLGLVERAVQLGRPHAMAFVDVRMPPGWDGVETTFQLWKVCPDLQVVICTAYSDYSWDDMTSRLNNPDQLLILKKPFETMEVVQLAHALTEKWRLHQGMKLKMDHLEKVVQERTSVLQHTNAVLEVTHKQRQEAMATVKTLEGLLPICAHCKKIRDDKGDWNQIEFYIRDRTNAQFSHGICPTCAHEQYPQFCLPR